MRVNFVRVDGRRHGQFWSIAFLPVFDIGDADISYLCGRVGVGAWHVVLFVIPRLQLTFFLRVYRRKKITIGSSVRDVRLPKGSVRSFKITGSILRPLGLIKHERVVPRNRRGLFYNCAVSLV